jgi:hypothetical protein
MENQPFASTATEWSQETISTLTDNEHPENTYLEYKRHLRYQDDGDTSKAEWRSGLERELTAFANASGGFIVFGMSDDVEAHGIEPPDHDTSQSVNQLINEATPPLETDVETIPAPHGHGDRVLIVVGVPEADRKPVATSDSAYFVRMNDHKEPMNREQIESLFVEADRRQQAIRQLEFELESFLETYRETFDDYQIIDAPPEYHLIDKQGLKEVFRQNTHLYTDDQVGSKVQSILRQLRDIDSQERYYGRVRNGIISSPYDDHTQLNKETRREFRGTVHQLHNFIEQLIEVTDLPIRE